MLLYRDRDFFPLFKPDSREFFSRLCLLYHSSEFFNLDPELLFEVWFCLDERPPVSVRDREEYRCRFFGLENNNLLVCRRELGFWSALYYLYCSSE